MDRKELLVTVGLIAFATFGLGVASSNFYLSYNNPHLSHSTYVKDMHKINCIAQLREDLIYRRILREQGKEEADFALNTARKHYLLIEEKDREPGCP